MSQQELLDHLGQLREKYSEQKRHISALLNEVKEDYGAQRKAHDRRARIKEDYIQYQLFYPEEPPPENVLALELPPVAYPVEETALSRIRSKEKALDELLKALRAASEALRTEPLDVVKLAKAQELLTKVKVELLPELPDILERYERIISAETERLGVTFGTTLYEAFAAEGLTLNGRPPYMHVGRFGIALNFTKRTATLFYGKEPLGKGMRLSAELILKAYRAAHKDIYGREVDGEKWIKQLYEAWRVVRFRQEDKNPEANLVACYIEMALQSQSPLFLRREPRKSLFKEYTRAQFAYDVDRFLRRQKLSCDGWVPSLRLASKAQAGSSERSMWIVQGDTPDSGDYMSVLIFRKEG